jgi:chromosome segregation ATPase
MRHKEGVSIEFECIAMMKTIMSRISNCHTQISECELSIQQKSQQIQLATSKRISLILDSLNSVNDMIGSCYNQITTDGSCYLSFPTDSVSLLTEGILVLARHNKCPWTEVSQKYTSVICVIWLSLSHR